MAISKINTRALANDSVTTDKVADNAITTDMVASGEIGVTDLADGAITNAKISATAAIAPSKIDMASVTALTMSGHLSGDTATFTGDIAINNGSPELYFGTTGTHYNWMLAAQENLDQAFEISVGSQDTDYSNDTYSKVVTVKADGNMDLVTGGLKVGGTTVINSSRQAFFTAATGSSLKLERSDVGHGMTAIAETATFGHLTAEGGANGGLRITALADTASTSAFNVSAYAHTPSTDGNAAVIRLRGSKKNGTGEQAIADSEDLLSIGNVGTERIIVKGNGDFQVNGTTVIDSSRAGNFNTGTVVGTYTTAPSGSPGQLAISRTGSAPYVSWHHEDGTRLGNIQFANASNTLYLSNEMSNGKWNFWNGTTTAAEIDHNGAAYFGGATQAAATRFVHAGGIKFSNGASTGGEFLSWDNEGATGNQSLIGYWYDGSSYRNRFRVAGDHGETVVNGSGDDVDFRVASDGNQDMLFLDASANKIGIGSQSYNYGSALTIHDNTAGSAPTSLFLRNSGTAGGSGAAIQFGYTSGYGAQIRFSGNPSSYRMASTTFATVTGDSSTQDNLQISTSGDTIIYNDLGVGHAGNPNYTLDVEAEVSGDWLSQFYNTHTSNGYGLKVRAGDNGDVTSFRVSSQSNANTLLNVYGDGNVSKPNTTCFLGYNSAQQSNIAVSTNVTVVLNAERFDQGSDFGSNVYIAPLDGKYLFSYSVYLRDVDTAASYTELRLVTSNRVYDTIISPKFTADPTYMVLNGSVIADMETGDQCFLRVVIGGGAAQVDIGTGTWLSGTLIA
jgi:hypothetical protein